MSWAGLKTDLLVPALMPGKTARPAPRRANLSIILASPSARWTCRSSIGCPATCNGDEDIDAKRSRPSIGKKKPGWAREERARALFGTDQRITSGSAAKRLHSKAGYAPEALQIKNVYPSAGVPNEADSLQCIRRRLDTAPPHPELCARNSGVSASVSLPERSRARSSQRAMRAFPRLWAALQDVDCWASRLRGFECRYIRGYETCSLEYFNGISWDGRTHAPAPLEPRPPMSDMGRE
jgi:hypothetical protein